MAIFHILKVKVNTRTIPSTYREGGCNLLNGKEDGIYLKGSRIAISHILKGKLNTRTIP